MQRPASPSVRPRATSRRSVSVRPRLIGVLSLAATLALQAPVAAATGPVLASPGTSPFAGCTADDPLRQAETFGSTSYVGSEVEPMSAVDPTDHDTIVGLYLQDRWSDGGGRGLVASVTHDGGATWHRVVLPGMSRCSGGAFDRATDPWVTFGPDGVLYASGYAFDVFDRDDAILVTRSTDGGETWSAPVAIARTAIAGLDKESITADPTHPGTLYAAWNSWTAPGGSEHANLRGVYRSGAPKQRTFFARSTDGGTTWSAPVDLFYTSMYSYSIGAVVSVLPGGTLIVGATVQGDAWRGGWCGSAAVQRSLDGGRTWLNKPILVAPYGCTYYGPTDPDTGEGVRIGRFPNLAVDGSTVHAVWEDDLPIEPGVGSIHYSRSLDGGLTWSTPVAISPSGANAFVPSIAVNAAGAVGVTYYDFRNNTAADGIGATDLWLTTCSSSCTDPTAWNETRVTPGSFDIRQAPRVYSQYFLGDYGSLATDGTAFEPFFIGTVDATNPTEAYFASLP